jgi:signal transduction histidine kinase
MVTGAASLLLTLMTTMLSHYSATRRRIGLEREQALTDLSRTASELMRYRMTSVVASDAILGRIFEAGYSFWRDQEGTGLGLSIVREILKRHHRDSCGECTGCGCRFPHRLAGQHYAGSSPRQDFVTGLRRATRARRLP